MSRSFLKKKYFAGKNLTAYDQIKEELKVLRIMEHPNVIFLREVIDDPDNDYFYLVTDFYSSGSIGDRLKKLN